MSLSSQYLEELSRRYKKQVEEIQNLLERTVISLREESFKKDLRNKQLEDRLDNLTSVIETLVNEKHNWFLTIFWLIFSSVLIPVIYFFCRKYAFSKSTSHIKDSAEILYDEPINSLIHNLSENKERRPSDQALNVLHYSAVNRIVEHNFNQRQKKRKKRHILKKSNSIGNIKDDKCYALLEWEIKNNALDWVEKHHQTIENTPYILDESDHTALETYPLENKTLKFDSVDNTSSCFNIKIDNKSSSHCFANTTVTENSCLNISLNEKLLTRNSDCVKKEKKSFKKLLKKVF